MGAHLRKSMLVVILIVGSILTLQAGVARSARPESPPSAPAARRATPGFLLATQSTPVDRVLMLDATTGDVIDPNFISELNGNPDVLDTPIEAILGPGGDTILVSDQVADAIFEYDLNGEFIRQFNPITYTDNIRGIALRPNGNVLATVDGANALYQNTVVEFDPDGNFVGTLFPPGTGGVEGPFDIYRDGNEWLVTDNVGASAATDYLYRFSDTGSFIGRTPLFAGFPQQITRAASGSYLLGNFSGTGIEGVYEYTSALTFTARYDPNNQLNQNLNSYRGVHELPNGNILTTASGGIYEIARTNTFVDSKIGDSVTSGMAFRYINYIPLDVARLGLTKTVGTDPAACASTKSVTVLAGAAVTYCYTATNLGTQPFTTHTLVDDQLGQITDALSVTLLPGQSIALTKTTTLFTSTVNVATWSAGAGAQTVTATDSASVIVLSPATIAVAPEQLSSVQFKDTQITRTLTISNTASGTLEWSASAGLARATAAQPRIGEELERIDAGANSANALLLGVEFAKNHYWATSGGATLSGDPNLLLQIDRSGQVVRTFTQPTTSTLGWRDLAFDGQFLYGSDSDRIVQISTITGQTTGVSFPSPYNPTRALAYDPASDHFWVANQIGPIYEIDRSGAIITTVPNGLNVTGLGWDSASPGGPYLWIWSQDGPAGAEVLATQFDPQTGQRTGIAFRGAAVPGINQAGGATVTTALEPGQIVLVALHRSTSDWVVNYSLGAQPCAGSLPWASVSPAAGTVAAGGSQTVEVTLDSAGVVAGTHTGALCIASNDPGLPIARVPVTMTVELAPTDLTIVKTVSADTAPIGSALTYTLTIINSGAALAESLVISDTLPAGLEFTGIVPGAATCSGAPAISCTLAALPAGESRQIMIGVRATALGTIVNTAGVSGANPETNSGNNSSAASLTVTRRTVYLPLIAR